MFRAKLAVGFARGIGVPVTVDTEYLCPELRNLPRTKGVQTSEGFGAMGELGSLLRAGARKAAILALLALPLLAPVTPADAAQIGMCRAAAAGAVAGPGRWTAAASNTTYTVNNGGCILISPADLGDAQADGFLLRSQLFNAVAYRFTAATSIVIPAGTYIDRVIIQETSGGAVTGGLKIGTTSGGTDVAASITCAASCLTWVPDVSLSTRIFASTAPQTLFMGAVTNFNSGPQITVTVVYGLW
jgi:hypothetical protein